MSDTESSSIKLCECGCGAPVRKRFVSGHNKRGQRVKRTCSHCGAIFWLRRFLLKEWNFCSRSCARESERRKAAETLETGYSVEPETGCWIWLTCKSRNDYAYVNRDKKSFTVHRSKWEQVHGPQPPNTTLHHLCETPACVNPDHLQVLSRAEHLRVHHAKLDLEDARKIRELHKRGRTQASIATEFGVDNSAISRIINGHKLTE